MSEPEVIFPTVQCPYCWEMIELEVDPSAGETQKFVSDCDVCCRPIEFTVQVGSEGDIQVESKRDSD